METEKKISDRNITEFITPDLRSCQKMEIPYILSLFPTIVKGMHQSNFSNLTTAFSHKPNSAGTTRIMNIYVLHDFTVSIKHQV